jgi:xylulokinase
VKYLLGLDIGSSFVKAALLEADTGKVIASASSPDSEMPILSPEIGFAEQDPEQWWKELIHAVKKLKKQTGYQPGDVGAIGISYQMHGLVCIDKYHHVLRPAIIWCDSRAVGIGNNAFLKMGKEFCLRHYLNSPGNFTASKLKWVKDHEPEIYERIFKALLPGDFIALRLTGHTATTVSGLSEAILWDFQNSEPAHDLLRFYGIEGSLLPDLVPTFGEQGRLCREASALLGLDEKIPVSYRAGDQPNNAYSLNVLKPGEIAATAGTSGVVYGVTDKPVFDPESRVNPFVHVNHTKANPSYGILLCVNGTGSLNSWLRHHIFTGFSYELMNKEAAEVQPGADGLQFYPFGNGAERILGNMEPGAMLSGLQFSRHGRAHIARAAQEGIVFALNYGIEIMQGLGLELKTVRAGLSNMFLSEVFSNTFANVSGCLIELYNTDGAAGAARAAGVGAKLYSSFKESFHGMNILKRIEPLQSDHRQMTDLYQEWKKKLPLPIS